MTSSERLSRRRCRSRRGARWRPCASWRVAASSRDGRRGETALSRAGRRWPKGGRADARAALFDRRLRAGPPPIRSRCSGARASTTNGARPSRRSTATPRCCARWRGAARRRLAPAAGARRRRPPAHALRRDRRGRAQPDRRASCGPPSWRARRRCPGRRASSWCGWRRTPRARSATPPSWRGSRARRAARRRSFDLGRDRAARRTSISTPRRRRRGRPPRARGGPSSASGCRLDLPRPPDGRGGARLLRVAFEVPAGAMTSCSTTPARRASRSTAARRGARRGDALRPPPVGGACAAAGGTPRPRASPRDPWRRRAARARACWVAGAAPAPRRVRYVDPRDAVARRTPPAVVDGERRRSRRAARGRAQALADYCTASPRSRREATDDALAQAARLRARPRFALGLALAAAIAHDDPTRPPSFARDARAERAARRGVDRPDLARAWHDLAALALEDERPRDAIDAGPRRRARRARAGGRRSCCWRARSRRAGSTSTPSARSRRRRASRRARRRPPRRRSPARCIEALRRPGPGSPRARRGGAAGVGAGRVRRQRRGARRAPAGARRRRRRASRRCARRCASSPERDDLASDLASVLAAEGRHDERARRDGGAGRARSERSPAPRCASPTRRRPPGSAAARARRSPRAGGPARRPRGAARGARAGRAAAARRIPRRRARDHPRLRSGGGRATPRPP